MLTCSGVAARRGLYLICRACSLTLLGGRGSLQGTPQLPLLTTCQRSSRQVPRRSQEAFLPSGLQSMAMELLLAASWQAAQESLSV